MAGYTLGAPPRSKELSPIQRSAQKRVIIRWDQCLESGFFAMVEADGRDGVLSAGVKSSIFNHR